ncbi:MAG TPA: hypothetical protein VMV77_21320 [Bacteroidales bacterium]|nr:hypothetical protein [Bacteroidales bacterium]
MAGWQTQRVQFGCDGAALATAEVVTATGTVGDSLYVGRCDFDVDFTVSGYSGGDAFDQVLLVVQCNTLALPDTWTTQEVGNLCLGDATARGSALTSVTNAVVGCKNQGDNQVRLYAYLTGSAVTATVTAKLYPRARNIA